MKYRISSLVVSTLFILSTSALAQEPEHAVVFNEDLCGVVVEIPDVAILPFIGDQLRANVRPGPDGFPSSGKYTCHGSHGFDLERAFTSRVVCYVPVTPFGPLITEEGRLVISTGGQWTAQCQFHREKEPT